MGKIRYIPRSALRVLYKVRHHRGHGIHSPFLFSLITKVIEEKSPYYAYDDIDSFLTEYAPNEKYSHKIATLSFRMINYFNAKNILEIGANNKAETLYLTASSSQIKCISILPEAEDKLAFENLDKIWNRDIKRYNHLPKIEQIQDCIIINFNDSSVSEQELFPYIMNVCHEQTFIILKCIRTNDEAKALWRKLRDSDETSITLDLFNLGIIFFNKKLFKRNYRISF